MTDNLDIPDCLRRRPGETRKVDYTPAARVLVMPDSRLIARHRIRKLRREERRLSDLIDAIGPRDQARRKRLYALIRDVEIEIAKREAELAALP